MKRRLSIRAGFFIPALILLSLAGSCSDDSDSEEASEALEERLTSSLQFEGGTIKEGEPPEEHADDAAFPQVVSITAPAVIQPRIEFSLNIEGDTSDPGKVMGAVVAVNNADSYLEVLEDYDANTNLMVLKGVLGEDRRLLGRNFSISVALLDTDYQVGNYKVWKVEITSLFNSELLCGDVCLFNSECGFLSNDDTGSNMSVEECKVSCKDDTAKMISEHGEVCAESVKDVIECAMSLSCNEYIGAFHDEPLQCLAENRRMDEKCPNIDEFSSLYNL